LSPGEVLESVLALGREALQNPRLFFFFVFVFLSSSSSSNPKREQKRIMDVLLKTTTTTTTQKRRLPPCVEGLSLFYSCSFIDNDGDGNVFFVLLEKRSRYFPGTTTTTEDENISFLPFLSSSFDASRKTRQNAIFFFFFFTRNDTARDAIDERTHQRKKTRLYFPR